MATTKITGIGHYLPEKIVTNHDLQKFMDTSDEWIVERTGIRERRWVEPGESVSGLGLKAAKRAMENAGITEQDIDYIIFATMASDYEFPGASCFLQEKLGLPGVPTLDIRNQCTGFVYGLSIADQYIKSGAYKNILLVGAEIQSTGLDLTTRGRDMAVLFGDGAGAVVLSAADEDEEGIIATKLHADGRYAKLLWQEYPSSMHHPRIPADIVEGAHAFPVMEGRQVFKHAVTKFPAVINETLEAAGYKMDDVDLLVPHQANLRITEAVARRLGIGMDKMFSNIHKYGNTTAATIPIGLSEALAEGRIKKGSLVAIAAFGGGFTWAASLIRW